MLTYKDLLLNVNLTQGLWVKTRNSALPPGVRPTVISPLVSRFFRLRDMETLLKSESAATSSWLLGETVPLVRRYSCLNHIKMRR